MRYQSKDYLLFLIACLTILNCTNYWEIKKSLFFLLKGHVIKKLVVLQQNNILQGTTHKQPQKWDCAGLTEENNWEIIKIS
mgnify:CR=1 FL=1